MNSNPLVPGARVRVGVVVCVYEIDYNHGWPGEKPNVLENQTTAASRSAVNYRDFDQKN